MKTTNVGVIGYGWAATAHIDAINATRQGQVTAVCSSRPLDAAGRPDAASSTPSVVARLAAISRGRAAARTVAAAAIIGERSVAPV